MCGIAGAIGAAPLADSRARAALASLAHRGPDAEGVWQGRVGGAEVALLHRRLSIIDLDPRANQPFGAVGCVVSYNGELYNHVELRRELEDLGHRFATTSDTEVLVRAYRQWDEGFLDRMDGMWAFVLADLEAGRVLLSRDRFGEKPFYWWWLNGTLYFASEVKALAALTGSRPAVNAEQLRRFLVNGYKSLHKRPATFFLDVQEFPAASLAVLERPVAPVPKRYWQLEFRPEPMTPDEAVAGTRAHLLRAVETRMRADVPVAFCLSGGVDSASLASIAAKYFGRKVAAFSILDSDERYDERRNIEVTVADIGCDWHPIETSRTGFLDRLAALIERHDAPVATISYYVHDQLLEAIAEAGHKVAISGTAADEIFTGYFDHYAFWLAEREGCPGFAGLLDDWRAGYGAHVRNPLLKDPLLFCRQPEERGHIYLDRALFNGWMRRPLAEDFEEAAYTENLLRRRMMNELFHESVPVILAEDDLNAMGWSVENRSPYLARELVEFLYTVPGEHLIRDGYAKWLLRTATQELNETVRRDAHKRGFNASIDSLLDRNDPEVRERLLASGPIFEIVRRSAVEDLLDGDLTDNSLSKFAFSFASAKLFLESDIAADGLSQEAA